MNEELLDTTISILKTKLDVIMFEINNILSSKVLEDNI